jgi:hypothetical protein
MKFLRILSSGRSELAALWEEVTWEGNKSLEKGEGSAQ